MKKIRNSKINTIIILIVLQFIGSAGLFAQNNSIAVTLAKDINAQDGYVIGGYDVVAYFIQQKPIKGKKQYLYDWGFEKWLFSSRENLELFRDDPEKYIPQYGGFCAYAAARGYKAIVDPTAWTIYKDKLYLNFSKSIQSKWLKKRDEEISKADDVWISLNALE